MESSGLFNKFVGDELWVVFITAAEKTGNDPEVHKSKQTKVMEYALSLAVKSAELNPHDASQTLAFWNEAEVRI